MIARVILINATARSLGREFDYSIPPEFLDKAAVGMRVLVPFGARNTSEEGIITELSDKSNFEKIKPIKKFLEDTPACSKTQLELCRWMQKKYLCSFSKAYKLVKPPRAAAKINLWITLSEKNDAVVTDEQQKIIDTLKGLGGVCEYKELSELIGARNLKKNIYALKDAQVLEIGESIKEMVSAKVIRKAHLEIDGDTAYEIADELFSRNAKVQANMLLTLADCSDMSTADLVAETDGNYTSLNSLIEKGFVSVYTERIMRDAYDEGKYKSTQKYVPTDEQKPIIEYLNNLIDENRHEKILLRGVTGSGKTEIFLQAIEHCISLNKQAIMLVPEISLTPQMVERFVGRFGNKVAVIHSGLSQGERFDQWTKIQNGEVSVVVGARSAVFAPFENIGIIILDEEHENSYKSENAPRYHAGDIAIKRGMDMGASVLFASATPEVSRYYEAKMGKYKLFEMHKRYNENAMPKARIVDMRAELFDLHNHLPISIRLQEEIRLNLQRKEKTILFLNRRGYNTFVSCRECGKVIECENCSIAMTYHKKTDKLVCHYCGLCIDNVKQCPECGSKFIKFFGTGTQRIEDELNKLFPDAKILRMDYDTTSKKGGHEMVLNKFKEGRADILLGTQMVTKGLDFPDVTLVGVLAADTALNVDDFRAGEKCFSLITQVCGRAGRGTSEGRAIIQTYQPQNRTINFAKEQDYISFYENEIIYRKRMDYPPFCDIVYVLVTGENEEEVKTEITNIGEILKEEQEKDDNIIKILGPSPAPISKIKNKYRYRVIVKTKNSEKLMQVMRAINDAHEKSKLKNTLAVDINPSSMV